MLPSSCQPSGAGAAAHAVSSQDGRFLATRADPLECLAWTNSRRPVYPSFVGEHEKLYEHIMLRRSDAGVPFAALCGLLKRLGFDERIRGDHHIFAKGHVEEILNLQPKGGRAKPYQVRQIREALLKYNLRLED